MTFYSLDSGLVAHVPVFILYNPTPNTDNVLPYPVNLIWIQARRQITCINQATKTET